MNKLNHLVLFLMIVLTQSVSAQIPEGEEIITVVEEAPGPEMREEYNEDGTYKRFIGDRIEASGFHKNKKLEGELKEFDYRSRLSAIQHYKKGVLHGVSTEFSPGSKTTRMYEEGEQVGYQETILSDGTVTERKGPYIKEQVSHHIFASYSRTHYTNDTIYSFQYDTIFLSANQYPEIHRWIERKNENDEIVLPTIHSECILHQSEADLYANSNLHWLLDDYSLHDYDFDYRDFSKPKEVKLFDEKGYPYIIATPDYWVTHRENHSIFDSVLNVNTNNTYNHFRFDDSGRLIFKAKKDVFDNKSKWRWTYDYMKNGNVFYSISSINYDPEKVWSTNDSITKVIEKGAFMDYYGTLYITQPNGAIDTSFSEEIIPYRYKNDLAPGKYYFLPTMERVRIEWIEVTAKGISYFDANVETPTTVRKSYKMNMIFQRDSMYHLFSGLRAYQRHCQVIRTKQGLVSIDFYSSDYDDYYSLEQLVALTALDTVLTFKSPILTEKQYLEVIKRKKITEMPKEVFLECLKTLDPIRKAERAGRDHLVLEIREEIGKQSRQLFKVIYDKGYNPYFTEDEFSQLMETYTWTPEEKREHKRIIRP